MKNLKYITLIATAAIVAVSCTKSEFDEFDATTAGTADFTTYIAVGNSLTQGFQDGGLHNEYQQQDNSYPAIIAKQMGVNFVQPTLEGAGSGHKFLKALGATPTITDVATHTNFDKSNPGAFHVGTGWNTWDKNAKYNNLGIAGVKLRDCVPGGTGSLFATLFNHFGAFIDFGSLISQTSYLDAVKETDATFFTNWLGNNDVLSWATGGGVDGPTWLTPVSEFRTKYDTILTTFTDKGALGVCATLPNVTSIPFFTTVPHNPIPLTDQAVVDQLNAAFSTYNNTLDLLVGSAINASEAEQRKISYKVGANNPILIMDESLTDLTSVNPALVNMRPATSEDLILLTSSSDIGRVFSATATYGVTVPFADSLVLTKAEVEEVNNHTAMLNIEIIASAADHKVAVVDMNAYMKTFKSGLTFDGVAFSTKYISGGLFSLDGVHPNGRGYALIANKFMETINAAYGANLRPVSIHDYRGIIFP